MPMNDTDGTPAKPAKPTNPRDVVLAVPVAAPDKAAYRTMHVEVNHLTPRQRLGYKCLYDGLVRERVKLNCGRNMKHPPDAIRWLLEQIAERSELV